MRLPWTKQRQPVQEIKSSAWLMGMAALRAPTMSYAAFAREGYGMNPVANACIEKVAKSAQSVDLMLYKRSKSGKPEKLEGTHELKTLLFEKPNPLMSGRKFIGDLVRYGLIGGNGYVLGTGMEKNPKARPKELYLLNPQFTTVTPNPNGQFPLGYEYKPTSGKAMSYPVDAITGRSAILHVRSFNPTDQWNGHAPMGPAASQVDTFNEGQNWNNRLLQNECRPSGALTAKSVDGKPGTLTEDQHKRLKTQIDEQFSGSGNAGRPLLLEGGLEWAQMSLSARDMDHKENMLNAARFIAGVFGVPPMLVNIPGDSTYANFEQARMALWTDTVLPLLSLLCDEFNRWLVPLYGDDLFIWYDEEMIPALEPLRKAKADRINAASYISTDEKRAAMGYDAYDGEGGKQIFVPAGNIPLDLAGDPLPPEPGSPDSLAIKPKKD